MEPSKKVLPRRQPYSSLDGNQFHSSALCHLSDSSKLAALIDSEHKQSCHSDCNGSRRRHELNLSKIIGGGDHGGREPLIDVQVIDDHGTRPVKHSMSCISGYLTILISFLTISSAHTQASLEQSISQHLLSSSRPHDFNHRPQIPTNLAGLLQQSALLQHQQQQQQQQPSHQLEDSKQSHWTHDYSLLSGPDGSTRVATLSGLPAARQATSGGGGLTLLAPPALQAQQHQNQFVPYQTMLEQAGGGNVQHQSTTPSISRQLVPPPQFYELGLSPVGALQVGSATIDELTGQDGERHSRASNATARSLDNSQTESQLDSAKSSYQNSEPSKDDGARNGSADAGKASDAPAATAADKTIEPRQRRRLFNRILKKAEWNHLFVELSKVFLRYFLDLALKDIIGKQSGNLKDDGTTSRKKLDPQSELADLLKDLVKTAISNIQ